MLPLLLAATHNVAGTFVEIGAFDGISGSQTYLLERCFNWRGVLIEASPRNFAMLANTSRSSASVKVHSAVCDGEGEVEMMAGGGTVAGVVGQMSRAFEAQWKRAHQDCGTGPCRVKVPCRPLPIIMARAGFSTATYLALDVEGAEEIVLQTVVKTTTNTSAFPFDVVMVEADRHDKAKNARVRTLLTTMGMRQIPIIQSRGSMNDLFVRASMGDSRPMSDTTRSLIRELSTNSTWLRPMLSRPDLSPYVHSLVHGQSLMSASAGRALIAHRVATSMPNAVMAHLNRSRGIVQLAEGQGVQHRV